MKRILYLFVVALLSLGIVTACSSDKESNNGTNDDAKNSEKQQPPDKSNNKEEDTTDESVEKPTSGDNDEKKGDTSAGDFDDQKDLKLGDTAKIEDTLGKSEITISAIKEKPEIDGESSLLDKFLVAEVTVKNIGESPIKAEDVIDSLRLAEELETSGSPDDSEFFKSIDRIEGTLEPGKKIEGQAVFDASESDIHYIFMDIGLVASGAVKNQAIWSIQSDEVEK
ncbi:DUF4352 domain-containing protein [Lederbergia sp. NSJ-179]|uniref:DUF4352 domain-containing protein n=1 Tax=Lederbergia sp. NSJ-179 TaxID=2931402 RepID=UPI001FD0C95E|nr:DUF4352 domain-containing protein [Lederbergia sp. NSJ-179]MCJ7840231.1 DUF4352 domain-containing protein [Lederbergia sp. NSJ-179]